MRSSHNPYSFFVILSLTSDLFLASLMVMFRILSKISCHFKAWAYFFIASKQTAHPGSRPCIISSRNCLIGLFLIQRQCSSCCTNRLLLTTSSFLTSIYISLFVSIPFDGRIKFIRNITRVIIDCSV